MIRNILGVITEIFAGSTSADRIEFGHLTGDVFEDGWGEDYSNPSVTDKNPERMVMNDLFAKLFAFSVDVNVAGILPYCADITYQTDSHIVYNHILYKCLADNTTTSPAESPALWENSYSGFATSAQGAKADSALQEDSLHMGDGSSSVLGGAVGKLANATDGGAVGYNASTTRGGAIGVRATAEYGGAVGSDAITEYGGAVGSAANSAGGGAVGSDASTTNGGAIGKRASTTNGGAVGSSASVTDGGAVGELANATDGGAVGSSASAEEGFSGGLNAKSSVDSIQLGTGTNTEALSLQIYGNKLLDASGKIPNARNEGLSDTFTIGGFIFTIENGLITGKVSV